MILFQLSENKFEAIKFAKQVLDAKLYPDKKGILYRHITKMAQGKDKDESPICLAIADGVTTGFSTQNADGTVYVYVMPEYRLKTIGGNLVRVIITKRFAHHPKYGECKEFFEKVLN